MAEGETPDPLAEVTARLDALTVENAELRGRVEGMNARPAEPKPEPKPDPTYTRAQLDESVAAGRMTQAQADQIIEDQTVRKATSAAVRTAETIVTTATGVSRIDGAIAEYTSIMPDVLTAGTDARKRVEREFQAIIAAEQHINPGYKGTKADELKALRAAFGPVDALKQSRRIDSRQTHEETGGGRNGSGAAPSTDGSPKDMPARLKGHYEHMIRQGMYKGWDDPQLKKELTFVRQGRAA